LKSKIIDCVTFYQNNYIFELRYNILKEVVDYFVVCESLYDHKNKKKKIDFVNLDFFDKKKIKHIVLTKKFPDDKNIWKNQAIQRDFILENLDFASPDDYILFSDPDEIPEPKLLKDLILKKKYGIFMQKCFNYKFNLFNKYESPWEGTRICKKKNLNSINFMRQKVLRKNLNYNIIRIDKEKSIQIYNNGGWHFNNILSAVEISKKLKTFAHTEFSSKEFSSVDIINKKIKENRDLFNRGHVYEFVKIDKSFPDYLLQNLDKYKNFIISNK
tara:strand:+ start:1755 stop:2570 length:816 start_codon:yes stop_codon:yes gene_type:complete